MSEQSFGCTGGTAFVGLPRRRTALSHEGLDAQDLSLSLSSDAFSWCASGLLRAADEELTNEKHGHDAERLAQQAAVSRGVDAIAHPHSYDDRLEHAGGKTEGDAEDCALPLHPLAMAATEAIEVEVEQHHERQHRDRDRQKPELAQHLAQRRAAPRRDQHQHQRDRREQCDGGLDVDDQSDERRGDAHFGILSHGDFLTSPNRAARLPRRRPQQGWKKRVVEVNLKHTLGAHMKTAWARTICRLLVVLMVWTPYQAAQAAMIGTDQVVTSSSSADRGAVLSFINRSDVASQLQALGLDPATAKDRVAAMTDNEVQSLAGRINSMPAGADSSGVVLLIIVIVVIWWVWKRY